MVSQHQRDGKEILRAAELVPAILAALVVAAILRRRDGLAVGFRRLLTRVVLGLARVRQIHGHRVAHDEVVAAAVDRIARVQIDGRAAWLVTTAFLATWR